MGRGETLEAFAELLQIPTEKRAEFYQKMQTNFAKIFTSENVVLANVVDNAAAVSKN
jgi:L-fucose mutarotase/ribose pyranase (RbsD/FucU family)